MSETLEKEEPKVEMLGFRVGKTKKQEVIDFCEKRDWKLASFLRVAVEESMEKVISEGR